VHSPTLGDFVFTALALNENEALDATTESKWPRRIKRYGPLLAWIVLIFFFSSTAASASQTSRIIEPILRFIFSSASDETIRQYHFFIRKCAHFTEYAILAFWAVQAWQQAHYPALRNYRYLLAVLLVLLIASIDEFNQSFEPTRTSSVWDVGLDTLGGASMALLLKLIEVFSKGRRQPADGAV
jgi:VanZ family protein